MMKKKLGKFEKVAVPVAAAKGAAKKQPKAKDMLLQTYFTGLFCLILSVSMFLGTSYAWFTSEINNPTNEIYVGTLKVGLYKETGTEKPLDLADSNNKLFDSNIRWEPGYTALETIQITNEGDLAFQYVLTFTDGTLVDPTKVSLDAVAGKFDVWVFDHLDKDYVAPKSYAEINEKNGWEPVGTLAEVLDGKIVLDGNMVTVRKAGQEAALINKGTTDGVKTTDKYTIALHMKEEATADVMGQKISLNVKLVAYQKTSENDGMGSNAYDSGIVLAKDAAELKDALANGTTVVLASNITLKDINERVNMSAAMLDGNGKTITYAGEKDNNNSSVGVLTTSGGKISNLKIEGDNGRALYVTNLTSDLVVTDCVLSGAYSFNLNSAAKNESALISFINTTFNNWTSFANVAKHVYFTGCTFEDVLRPYGDTTLTDCTFITGTDYTKGLNVSKLETEETITLVNCKYNGLVIEKAEITFDGTSIEIDCAELTVNDDGMIVLK